jgi:hypothetical protein
LIESLEHGLSQRRIGGGKGFVIDGLAEEIRKAISGFVRVVM